MEYGKFYQVSTLQALALGYTRAVVSVRDFLAHGDTGLGTFKDVNGEMILVDGHCYRAREDGTVIEADGKMGIPFAAATFLEEQRRFDIPEMPDIDSLKSFLDVKIEEGFGLNSMHVIRVDGDFSRIDARSESAYESHHITLKKVLQTTQKDFVFENVSGTLICVYFPDYMDGINAPGWHLHFITDDRSRGGHVFGLAMNRGKALLDKIDRIEIQNPDDPAFDTYSLKEASDQEIKEVEQGK